MREKRSVIPSDYVVFLQTNEKNNGMMENDPINFHQAMPYSNSEKWIKAMNKEYKSMCRNRDRSGTAKVIKKKKQRSRHHSLL